MVFMRAANCRHYDLPQFFEDWHKYLLSFAKVIDFTVEALQIVL